jgi:hypothetical protein
MWAIHLFPIWDRGVTESLSNQFRFYFVTTFYEIYENYEKRTYTWLALSQIEGHQKLYQRNKPSLAASEYPYIVASS